MVELIVNCKYNQRLKKKNGQVLDPDYSLCTCCSCCCCCVGCWAMLMVCVGTGCGANAVTTWPMNMVDGTMTAPHAIWPVTSLVSSWRVAGNLPREKRNII